MVYAVRRLKVAAKWYIGDPKQGVYRSGFSTAQKAMRQAEIDMHTTELKIVDLDAERDCFDE
jgi:hypothetical protein